MIDPIEHRHFKTQLNSQLARIAKAVANPHRLEILDLLAQGERHVEDVAAETGLTLANASQHLQGLRQAHLVAARKEGLRVYYRLATPAVYSLLQIIREVAESQLAELDRLVETFLHRREMLEPMTLAELQARLDDPELVLLDVRPALEYEQGHIPGARSIPVAELAEHLSELTPEKQIVAYCRGPYCVFADEAVEILLDHGYQAQRVREGYPDWHVAGLPVETGPGLGG
ncbi:MAG: metalloregulator ArsR/SmtB family transcription factor [Chloroflexi bacterium]|nr:metalloregulator ArsR/SmtB family transcription factor [Chloroflexota bacterium]MCI0579145.1 metalloregulator ArsR/SmtB family transcription factor [Chloroflexota bacterium]MCI0643362.1 metalloregulator ArsR/SmtB family transcription factor [Chloroflexota bacterium]MCI0728341.1 metalloregulator ArsR/SmtB family transcription factor [Chloroflexota bacterium]